MELNQALEKLREIEKKQVAYAHATGLIYYDGVTAARLCELCSRDKADVSRAVSAME